MDGFKYGAGEDLRRSIARWSDFPQLGRRVGIRASVASENKFISRLGKGPSGGLERREAPAFGPGGLPALPASQPSDLTGSLASIPRMPGSIDFPSHINFSI